MPIINGEYFGEDTALYKNVSGCEAAAQRVMFDELENLLGQSLSPEVVMDLPNS
jgi:hypothetical protein